MERWVKARQEIKTFFFNCLLYFPQPPTKNLKRSERYFSGSSEALGSSLRPGGVKHLLKWWLNLCFRHLTRNSLVAWWIRIRLPTQGTWIRSLVKEDSTCCGATKPVCHNYWAHTLEPMNHNYWACMPHSWAHMPRACALPREQPPHWEAHAP